MCIIYVIGKCCKDKPQSDRVIANPNFLCYTKHAVLDKIGKGSSDTIIMIDIGKWRMIHVKG